MSIKNPATTGNMQFFGGIRGYAVSNAPSAALPCAVPAGRRGAARERAPARGDRRRGVVNLGRELWSAVVSAHSTSVRVPPATDDSTGQIPDDKAKNAATAKHQKAEEEDEYGFEEKQQQQRIAGIRTLVPVASAH